MSTSVGSLFLELRLDTQSYQQALENARVQAQNIGKQIEGNLRLDPQVNHKELTKLNEHLSLKQKHFKEVQRDFDRNPLTPRVNLSEIRQATNEIKKFKRLADSVKNPSGGSTSRQKVELEIDTQAIAKAVEKGMKGGGGLGKMIGDLFTSPFRLAAEAGKRVFIGAFEGIGQEITQGIGAGVKQGLERELGSYIGSFKLLGRKIGEGFAQEFVDALGDELESARPIFEEVLGKKNIVQESAAVRAKQAQQQRQMQERASDQLVVEAQFFTQNREAIRSRVERLDRRRESANQVRQSLDQKVQKTAESLGVKGLQERLKKTGDRRQELADSLSQEGLSSNQIELISSQVAALSRTYRSISDEIDSLNRAAAKRFQSDFDRLSVIEEKLRKEERGLMNIIEAPQRLDFAIPTAKTRDRIMQQQKANLPTVYKDLAREVAARSGMRIDESQIPMLKIDSKLQGDHGRYDPKKNEIHVSPDLQKALHDGVSLSNIEVLSHELRHAAQMGFGKIKDIAANPAIDLIQPNQQEARQYGRLIERSTGAGTNAEARRRLESDAYIFAGRNREEIFQKIQKSQAIARMEAAIGVGGGKAELNINRGMISGVDKLGKIADIAAVDVSEELQRAIARIEGISSIVTSQLDKLTNLDVLGVDEIEQIQQKVLKSVEIGLNRIVDTTNEFKQQVLEKPAKLLAQSEELLPTFSRKQLNNLATDLGLDYKGKSKRDLVSSLLGVDIDQLSPKVLDISRQRSQQMLQRQEQMSAMAEGAGNAARMAFGVGKGVINAGRTMLAPAGNAIRQGYAIAQGMEDIALSALPFGKSGKSLLRNVILPSAGFAALSHYAPGGQMLASGMGSMVHHGTDAAIQLAQSGIGNALSKAPWAVQTAAKPITMLANWGVSAAQPMTESVLTALLGGRLIGSAASAASKPLRMPLSLPQREKELALLPERQKSQTKAMQLAIAPAKLAEQTSKELQKVSSSVDWGQFDQSDIERVKAIGKTFSESYKGLKDAISKGAAKALEDAQVFVKAANHAEKDIDTIIAALKDSGVNTGIGSKVGSTLEGIKGQIVRKRNLAQNEMRVMSKKEINQPIPTIDTNATDERLYAFEDIRKLFAQVKNRVLRRQQSPDETIQRNLANQAKFDLGEMQINKQYEKATSAANAALERLSSNTESTLSRVKRILAAESNQDWFKGLTSSIKGASAAFLGFTAVGFIAPLMGQITAATTKTGLEFEALGRRLSFIEGSSEKGAAQLANLKQRSDELGLSFRESAKAYVQFASTTEGTSFEGFQTKDLADKVAQASSSRGLTAEQQNRLNLGVTQMLGKGKVSQEELRQQIAEVLPGFTQVAARSQGVSVAQLNEMIKSGMDSAPFLTKAFSQYSAENSSLTAEGAKSTQGAINRLDSAIVDLQAKVGKGLLPGVGLSAEIAASSINLLTNNIGLLLQMLTAAALTAGTFAVQGIGQLITYNGGLLASLRMLIPSFAAFKSAIASVMPIVGRFIAVMAILEGIKLIGQITSDASGSFGEFADSAEKGLKRYETALANANGQQKDFIKNLPTKRNSLKGDTWFDDIPLLNMLPKDFRQNYEDFFLNKDSAIGRFNPSAYIVGKKSEKEANDQMSALDRYFSDASKISQGVKDQLSGKEGDLIGLQKTNLELEKIATERAAIASQQKDMSVRNPRLEALKSREQQLSKERDRFLKPIGELSAGVASRIENANKIQDDLNEKLSKGAITQSDFAKQSAAVAKEIESARKDQEALNIALRDSNSKMTIFERNMQKIAAQSTGIQQTIEMQGNINSTAIAQQELSGGTQRGQSDFSQQQNQQAIKRQIIDQKIAERKQILAELQAADANSVLSAYSVTNQTSAAELKDKAERTSDDRAKKFLNSMAQVKELEATIAQNESELAGQLVQTQRTLDDSNRAIADYYRSIQRQVEDINSTIKSREIEIRSLGLKDRLNKALNGMQASFVDDLLGALFESLDVANKQAQNVADAVRERTANLRSLEDTTLQGQDLARGLPMGGTATSQAAAGSKIAGGLKVTNRNDPDGGGYGFDYGVWDGGDSRGVGAPVAALAGGKVVKINRDDNKYGMGGQRGFGNQVLIRVMNPETGQESDVGYGHLNDIAVKLGDVIGRGQKIGTQGETGSASAPHVTLNVFAKGGYGGGSAEVALGRILERSIDKGVYANVGNIQQQAQTPASTGSINLATFFQGGSNSLAAKVIGMAEGNRTASGGFTQHAKGHTDPGNGAYNIGSFSAQGGLNRGSIAASDEAVINELLKPYASKLAEQASRVGVQVTPKLLLNYLDTLNQGGSQVVTGWNDSTKGAGFLGKLAMIKGRENDDAAIRQLRVESYRNTSGRLETTFANQSALERDQQRRMGELARAQSAFGLGGMSPVDLSGIQGSLSNATGANNASIDQLATAKNNNLQTTADLNLSRVLLSTTDGAKERFTSSRQTYEAVMNNRRGLGISSIESKLQQDIEDTERTARDTIEEGQKRLRQYQADLNKLDRAESVLKELQTLKRITPEQFKTGSDQIAEARKKITEAVQFDEKAIAQAEQNRKDIILDLRQKAAYEIAKREQVIQKQFNDQTLERFRLTAEAAERMRDPMKAIDINSEAQRFEVESSIQPAILEQEEFGRQNKLSREQVEKLIANVKELAALRLEKITYEARKLREELEASSRQEVFNSFSNLAEAQIQSLQILGLDTFAKDIQRERSLVEARMQHSAEMKRLNETPMLPDERKIAQSNVDRTLSVKIDNIKRQYSVLNEVISQNRGAFEGFFSGILSGTDSIGSAFTKMIQSIAGNLANLASKYLTDELIGLITGKSRKANEQDAKGMFEPISPTKTYDQQGRELAIAASDAGTNFKGLTEQAGRIIIESGNQFAQAIAQSQIGMEQSNLADVIDRKFSLTNLEGFNSPLDFLNADSYGFGDAKISGWSGNVSSNDDMRFTKILSSQAISSIGKDSQDLFTTAENSSFAIAENFKVASEMISDAGTQTSDNLLSGLNQGLPGVIQGIVGLFGGGKKGGGGFLGILNSVLGIAGGLFGGGGGAAMPDIASPVLNLVPNFAKGGFVSDDRPFIDGSLFKGNNPIAQAVKREGSGAIVGVMNRGEYVLTAPEAQMYFALGFDKIVKGKVPNFRSGGSIGMGAAGRFSSGQQISISVPVTVSDGSSVDPQKLGESIRGAVQNEIARQQRPGGQLY